MVSPNREWAKRSRERLYSAFGSKCAICGYARCRQAMDLHHIDPKTKVYSVAELFRHSKSWGTIVKEAEKCVLLCCRCHRELHAGVASLPEQFTRFDATLYEAYDPESSKARERNCIFCGAAFKHSYRKCCSEACRWGFQQQKAESRRKVRRPSKEVLADLLWKKPTSQLALDFGVSDKAIAKWARQYGLEKPPRGYWAKLRSCSVTDSTRPCEGRRDFLGSNPSRNIRSPLCRNG